MSITQPRALDELSMAAARLARGSPQSWDEFKAKFRKLSDERSAQCVAAPAQQVFLAQGRAQSMVELLALFEEAIARANELEAKMKERSNGR